MKNNEFIDKLKHIASLPTVYYSVSGGDWAKWNGKSWNFDCVILIKAILWGWCENKNHAHGGAKYLSNGVKDVNADGLINLCTNVSSDFRNITPGEVVWCKGHVGVYIGNRQVIEATAAWDKKVQYSTIGDNGERSKNGRYSIKWLKHGKLPYITYEVSTVKTVDELAQEVIEGKWGNGDDRKNRLTKAGYNYRGVQDRVNELVKMPTKKYIQINTTAGVWCRTGGYGFNYPKYKVIPYQTKCELLSKNLGYANGYNWDKVKYDGKIVFLPNKWNKYVQ